MKPILFDGSATNFTTNGLGVLSSCISCPVTEERNGIFEVEFEYPITGVRYESITEGRIILVSHDETKTLQPFIIYRISKAINGIVTVNARHLSYQLINVIVEPYSASSITAAFSGFQSHAMTPNPFTFWTDKSSTGTFKVDVPSSVRSLLGGSAGSILDAFGGGEYEFDNYTVKLHAHRGTDSGVTIRYGKNLTDITQESDSGSLYNAVVPYWDSGDGTVIYGNVVQGSGGIVREEMWTDEHGVPIQDENGNSLTFHSVLRQAVPMNLSGEFEEEPTAAQLEAKAQTILNNNEPWIPSVNIKVDFIALWQTEEYKDIAPLERVKLCDTVTVEYPALGVQATAKVIKTVWNALTERYDEIELGDAQASFADTIMGETKELLSDYPSTSYLEQAIDHATQQITGGLGGNIVFTMNAESHPIEQLIMDTDDVATAVNVWRWNLGGLGHSHSGYLGPFDDIAITQDGKINASMITTGYMRANRIQGGELTLGGANNGNGVFRLLDAANNLLGAWNNAGMTVSGEMDFAGWKLDSENLGKASEVTPGVASTWYRVYLSAPNTITGSDIAMCAYEAPYNGTTFGDAKTNFVLLYDGSFTATKATITGDITATSGAVGGFEITSTAIKTKNVDITSNAANSIGLSSVDFSRTIGGINRTGLRFAIGANFGVTGGGVLYASSVNLSGTITTTDNTRRSVLDSGFTKYYYGNTYIGDIGASIANSEQGLVFDLKTDGDYIGWFINGTTNPVMIYSKDDWLTKDVWSDCISITCDLHISSGSVLAGSCISDPSWRFSNTTYAGYNGTVSVSGVVMTFKKGVLVSATN